jgi:hypothetical protein
MDGCARCCETSERGRLKQSGFDQVGLWPLTVRAVTFLSVADHMTSGAIRDR